MTVVVIVIIIVVVIHILLLLLLSYYFLIPQILDIVIDLFNRGGDKDLDVPTTNLPEIPPIPSKYAQPPHAITVP